MDWNNDGKKDLITGSKLGYILIYINAGTDKSPQLRSHEMLKVEGIRFKSGYETGIDVFDWNNDGKKDILYGNDDGYVYILINSGDRDSSLFLNKDHYTLEVNRQRINLGSYIHPVAADWNGDGKKDLIVGEANGSLYYLENKGSDDNPVFQEAMKLRAGDEELDIGIRSRPEVIDWNNDGVLDILCGGVESWKSAFGFIWYFEGEKGKAESSPVNSAESH
ncbi:VCBS repeat-containing protein [bacterium]|nr:VCBS repeat-containing protein [bacterium]